MATRLKKNFFLIPFAFLFCSLLSVEGRACERVPPFRWMGPLEVTAKHGDRVLRNPQFRLIDPEFSIGELLLLTEGPFPSAVKKGMDSFEIPFLERELDRMSDFWRGKGDFVMTEQEKVRLELGELESRLQENLPLKERVRILKKWVAAKEQASEYSVVLEMVRSVQEEIEKDQDFVANLDPKNPFSSASRDRLRERKKMFFAGLRSFFE